MRLSLQNLRVILKLVAAVTLLAFAAAVMPGRWIVETARWLGFDPFPESPLTYYLARNLSLMYGFIGAAIWYIATKLERYRDLVKPLALASIAFSLSQAAVNIQSEMPTWWIATEFVATFTGGIALVVLDRLTVDRTSQDQASLDE